MKLVPSSVLLAGLFHRWMRTELFNALSVLRDITGMLITLIANLIVEMDTIPANIQSNASAVGLGVHCV